MQHGTLYSIIALSLVAVLMFVGFTFLPGNQDILGGLHIPQKVEKQENQSAAVLSGGENQDALNNLVTVRYTDQGFVPFITEIKLGQSVRFVNESTHTLFVTSEDHPTAVDQNYPGFSSSKSIGKGEEWALSFTKKGSWGYKNLNKEEHLGTIVVTE